MSLSPNTFLKMFRLGSLAAGSNADALSPP